MAITKMHFEAFAREIRDSYEHTDLGRREAIAAADIVAKVLSSFNPRFDRDRFLKACGLEVS